MNETEELGGVGMFGGASGEYFVMQPTKVRVRDMTRINEAALAEMGRLLEERPDDPVLRQFNVHSPVIGLKWFMSATRLEYVYAGIEMIMEYSSIASASRFPAERTGDHLHDWWIDEAPEYVV